MKVVQVTSSSKGGAGIAALRLHYALRKAGVASAYVSKNLTINFEGAVIEDPFFSYKKPSLVRRVITKLKRMSSSGAKDGLEKQLSDLQPSWDAEIVSLPFSNYKIESHQLVQQADIVNLHMVTGILSYDSFFAQCGKPIVWTLHDMNPFLGLFHYQGDHKKHVSAKQIDTTVQKIKKEGISKIEKGAIISPSQWLLKAAHASKVFDQLQEYKTIANGVDLEVFHPQVSNWRAKLGIGEEEKVLLFVAASLGVARKGGEMLLDALEEIRVPITLLTLGKGTIESANKAVKIIPLGFVSESVEIASCYATADAFVLPSSEDNLPNTMLESLAVGTPVISFAVGGMKEHIKNGYNGELAPVISAASLSDAIARFFSDETRYDSGEIRRYAESHFSLERQALGYKEVYKTVLE